MRSDQQFRVFGGCFAGCMAVVVYALTMAGLGQQPPPLAFVASVAIGFGFGWWRSGRMIRQRDAERRVTSGHTPVRSEEHR